jgi:ubiquinone/menaquinone biosynthesis C-methylase UbiE
MPRQHYDIISKEYASARQHSRANARYYDFWTQSMLEQVPESLENAVGLDCMSGSCEMARVASPAVAKWHATDISLGILQEAQPGNYSRTCADSHQLPYPANTFDVILIRGGLHHVRQSFMQVLAEVYRTLKPNGWLIFVEPADDNPVIFLLREMLHRISDLFEKDERGFSQLELETALAEIGFDRVSISPFGFVAYTLIGNTDVFPLMASLSNDFMIDLLLRLDRISPRIPIWRKFGLLHLAISRAKKNMPAKN